MLLKTLLSLTIATCCSPAYAGDSATLRGHSSKYSVTFQDPLDAPDGDIEIAEYVDNELTYTKKLPSVTFSAECRATQREIRCSKAGTSPLAGAVYRLTHDATPQCPGIAEDRFTCVKGCKPTVPRYISINPYEC